MTLTEKELLLEKCHQWNKNTLMEHFDISYTDIGDLSLTAQMPISEKVLQSHGWLHGGATAALAETVASVAAHIFFGNETRQIRGIKLSIDHIRSVSQGFVVAKTHCLHSGKTLQIWEIKIFDQHDKLIALASLTTIALQIQNNENQ